MTRVSNSLKEIGTTLVTRSYNNERVVGGCRSLLGAMFSLIVASLGRKEG